MNLLDHYAARVPASGWSLEEFVDAANRLLPGFLPAAEDRPGSAGKVRDEVNIRLVRHYANLGLLDDNAREGREARYGFRHLLQLLLVRRLPRGRLPGRRHRQTPRRAKPTPSCAPSSRPGPA